MQASAHLDRRRLDKTQRAEIAHHDGGYRVSAGEGYLVFNAYERDIDNYDAAYTAARMHDSHNGFDVAGADRRTS